MKRVKQNIGIVSTGYYVPENIVTNSDVAAMVTNYDAARSGVSLDEWLKSRYGIISRRWSDEYPSDQAVKAAVMAMETAGLQSTDIDFIILNTAFGDFAQPTTATEVQKKIGMRDGSFAMEINSPCAGTVFGMVTAMHFVASGRYKYGLVIGVDKMSLLIDKEDFKMAGLFGEGAGACIVSIMDQPAILDYALGSQGESGDPADYSLRILGGKSVNPTSQKTLDEKQHYLQMVGRRVEAFVDYAFKDVYEKLVIGNGMTADDIDYVVPHQASRNMVRDSLMRLGFDEEKVRFTVEQYGNTSAASILITLHDLLDEGVTSGSRILLLGMGGGLNWGGILYQVP